MKYQIGAVILCIGLAGCQKTEGSAVQQQETQTEDNGQVQDSVEQNTSESTYFSDRDLKQGYDDEDAVYVNLNDQSGVIRIEQEGVYVFGGEVKEGQILVEADENAKVQIVLDGAVISNSTTACIYVKQADKVFITTVSDSVLSHTGTYEQSDENNVDGVIFSKSDLTLNGTAELTVSDDNGHGIVSKDDMAVTGGRYQITVSGKGLSAHEHIALCNVTVNINSGKDAISSENEEDTTEGILYIESGTYRIVSNGDCLYASGTMEILDGTFDLDTSESDSESKTIKSDQTITIHNGQFTLSGCDDGIHAGGDIVLNGGDFNIQAADDAIHSDANVIIYDGTYTITACYEGIEGSTVTIHDGTYQISASDDGINAASGDSQMFVSDGKSVITINGGNITIVSGGDCIDSNGEIVVNGGTLNLTCYGSGNTAIDSDGTFTDNGGDITTNDGSENGTGGMAGGKGGMPGGMGNPGKGNMNQFQQGSRQPA
ncbi:MAG: carbohydrate-binding domain-containing protein [Bulleidia sp.]